MQLLIIHGAALLKNSPSQRPGTQYSNIPNMNEANELVFL
jgi:hypothetical protein